MTTEAAHPPRPLRIALVTGVGRRVGIGHAVAERLRADGWEVVTVGWRPYDARMTWGADTEPLADHDADLADPAVPASLVETVRRDRGPITALVLCHCESVDSSILDTNVESFDRHVAVNARAVWLLIKAFAEQLEPSPGPADVPAARIVAFTSDHVAHNLPYGASKGALDRIVLAAATELAHLGVTANVINPGATDTGWMTPEIVDGVRAHTLQPRVGRPADAANLVGFLLSPEGSWINGQLLYSDGGLRR